MLFKSGPRACDVFACPPHRRRAWNAQEARSDLAPRLACPSGSAWSWDWRINRHGELKRMRDPSPGFFRMNRNIVWTIPAVDLTMFGICDLLLALLVRFRPRSAVRDSGSARDIGRSYAATHLAESFHLGLCGPGLWTRISDHHADRGESNLVSPAGSREHGHFDGLRTWRGVRHPWPASRPGADGNAIAAGGSDQRPCRAERFAHRARHGPSEPVESRLRAQQAAPCRACTAGRHVRAGTRRHLGRFPHTPA